MLQVKEGQLDKLGLLFERYNKSLYGFFYRLTLDREVSEDLVQNVFLRTIWPEILLPTTTGKIRRWAIKKM